MDDSTNFAETSLESRAESVLQSRGIDLETAYKNILQKIADNELTGEEIDKLAKPKKEKRPIAEMIGIFKGKIWMADDFNEPMECMKEYME